MFLTLSLIYSNNSWAQQFYPTNFDVTTLNGTNGFVVPGLVTNYKLGREVQFIGDINNDGFEDICLGNGNQTVGVNDLSGRAYIIFGASTGFSTPFDLTSLNGTNGFIVEGIGYDERRGTTVAGPGDINGDGIDDLIIGTSSSSSDDMVIYGTTTFPALLKVTDINGANGFLLDTPGSYQVASLGDVNGDSINDFIIGTPHWSGQSWIVFGRTSNYPALVDATWINNAVNGFRTSSFPTSRPSLKVGGAGDINNDGINDILIGGWNNSANPNSYALFGKNTSFDAVVNLVTVDGTDGFLIDNEGNSFITEVGPLGDINNDGIDDCFSENNIIFGSTSIFPANLLMSNFNGTNGFVLENYVGSAAPTGDVNFDGIDDFIVAGADDYVVFGKTGGFSPTFNSTAIDGANGFKIPLIGSGGGGSVDGGKDVNGDGITDFIFADTGAGSTGEVYVVFGGDHYAMPLNATHPQANNETTTGFDILVNGPETGTIHYVILPGTFSGAVNHNTILTGTGAIANGNFLMSTANANINEVISSLTAATTYDVHLFLEDGIGNKSIIYHLNNVTTLSAGDITPPSITCPANQTVTCGTTVIPDYTGLVTTTDIVDPSPVVTQSPVAGAAFVSGMIITMTSTDASLNSASCTFNVTVGGDNVKPTITCLISESLFINSTLPNYFFKLKASDNCTSIFNLTYTQVPAQGTVFTANTNVTVVVTDENGNTETCTFLVTVKGATPPVNCNTTSVNINDLDGDNGFQIDGDAVKAQLGHDVRGAGDVNGDGIQDFLVGSPNKAYNYNAAYGRERGNFPGNVFVVFGKGNNFLPNIDTVLLDGTDGFKIHNDIPNGGSQYSGYQVSTAGDINNDGIDDLMFSDPFRRNPLGSELGTIYVVFGKTTGFLPVFNLSNINGTNGFVFLGTDAYDQSGKSIDSAGDINNDGINDIIIGASTGRGTNNSGTCYVIYGKTGSFPALVRGSDLNGTNGFIIKGDTDGEQIGYGVVGLGDVNGDGIDDLGFEGGGKKKTYVLFGKTGSFPAIVATATINGTNGFYADISSFTSSYYRSITGVGDVNNDGIKDMLFGNRFLLFGRNTGFTTAEDITNLDGIKGVEFIGSTYRKSSAGGDFNNDGIDDLIIGRSSSSIAIVYGKSTPWDATLNPFSLPSSEAFKVTGLSSDYSVSDLADINGDGITDVIVGEKERLYYDSSTSLNPGRANVIYGFSVIDTEAPVITCPIDQVLVSGSLLPDYISLATVTDNCDTSPVITQAPVAGGVYTPGMTITLTATDKKGNSANCDFIVTDNTDTIGPTATNPLPINVQCLDDVPLPNPLVVTDEADNSGIPPTVAFVSDVNTSPSVITRTYSVTDGAGNTINVTQTITISDTIKPTATNPLPINVSCIGDVPTADITVVTDEADNCTGTITIAFVSDVNTSPGLITRTYSVTDVAGNTVDVTQTINISDTIKPTATNPLPINISCIGDVPTADITVVSDEIDNCTGTITVAFVSDVNTSPSVITRTYSVTDVAGNTINVTQIINVSDIVKPTASDPLPISISCIGDVPAADITVVTDEIDNCTGTIIVAFVSDVNTSPGLITRTYSVTDAAGNTINVTQTINVSDIVKPTASDPLPINVSCAGDIPTADITVVTDEADNCTGTIIVAFVSDVNTSPGIITRTYSVTDAAGNTINVTQTINVSDIVKPTASDPLPINVSCAGDIPAADITVVIDEADNCTGAIIVAFVSDVNTSPGIITRTYSVTDAAGNTIDVTQTINVSDIVKPTASDPLPINISCIGDVPTADITVVTDEADNCTGAIMVAFVSDVNTSSSIITRTYSVTDAAGNTINVTQTINVSDIIKPTASDPLPINISCIGDLPVADITVVTDEADNCTGAITVAFVSDVNTSSSVITRTYSVTDVAGNSINVTQTINVSDIIKPTASDPLPINISCIGDVPVADITVVTDAADNCTGVITVAFVSDVNTSPSVIIRTYSVTDVAGNSINVTQTITVSDTISPTATNPLPINVLCTGDIPTADISAITDEADNCTGVITVAFVNDMNTSPGVITRTYSVTDAAGNSTDVTQTITVSDIIPPTATNPAAIIISCVGDIPAADITVVAGEVDNCTGTITVAFVSDVSDGNSNPEIITRTYSVTDAVGNFTNVTQTIIVNDSTAPITTCPSNSTQKVDSGLLTAVVTFTNPVATDNCTVATINQTAGLPSGSEFPIGVNTISFEATDAAGNTATCSFTITIEAEDPLVCTVDAGTDFDIIEGDEVALNAVISGAGVIEWSPSVGVSSTTIANPIASPTETTTYTIRFVNAEGCVAEDTITVFVTPLEKDETKYGFSPDGDGINEYWEIDGIENYPNNQVLIYNRWGDLIFETTGYNNASNVFRGIANKKRNLGAGKLPEGTYLFHIKIKGSHNLKKEKGFLILKR
ncbi:HYR domain-containing protein [Tenacibaculum sp. Bg11-29]|uniref:HYR-like domain-containing protein n=1 Tax=Tenacibaculum sp. Bg11-29 TaxID=2058306 RepID=UPI0018E30B1E|nr:HYR domain-containing protein [Tenacibaculum sp. Bg11-29]